MKRKIIEINEDKCTGCGLCIPNCAEGALQVIDGKARLISDLFCDGLGACIGHCPEDAISVVEREAEEYDEEKVLAERILPAGANTLRQHLEHLRDHGATEYLNQALAYLEKEKIPNPLLRPQPPASPFTHGSGCPGSQSQAIQRTPTPTIAATDGGASELTHWPVQLHLINPAAPHFTGADLLISADCVAYARADLHSAFLRGKKLIIACPKLDHDQEVYLRKLIALVDDARINSITVLRMEVPCCGGIVALARQAVAQASRKIPIKEIIIGIDGGIRSENWLL
jgi:NAD-dependent dihydropyrimidine dehydrogenase PreA subunit